MTTNISEITEITNKTSDTWFLYVWDNAHEGRYSPYGQSDWTYPSDGKWLEIKPGAHLHADDCGIPDGGKSDGKNRVRVLFKKKGAPLMKGDPGRGLRMNRVASIEAGHDEMRLANHATGEPVAVVPLMTSMHQSLLLLIDPSGIKLMQTDAAESTEGRNAREWERVRTAMENVLSIAKSILEIAAE